MKGAKGIVSALLLAAGMLLLATGCVVPWPHVRVHAPAREGRVVAAADGSPVAGAVVTSLENGKQCVTGEDGRFELPEAKGWHWGKMVSPALVYSMWPFLDAGKREQPVRVEAAGFAGYDEENGSTEREVRYRSFGRGRTEDGRWWCPVETQRVEIARNITVLRNGIHSPEEWNAGAKSVGEMMAWGIGADKTVRLVREGEVPVPFSLAFDLADDSPGAPGAAPPPDGRPPKARVLWWGADAPMVVLFGERAPWGPLADAAGFPGDAPWLECEPFRIFPGRPESVVVTLDAEGRPARFALRLAGPGARAAPSPDGDYRAPEVRQAWLDARRDAVARGDVSFRVTAWEAIAPGNRGWRELDKLDRRFLVRDE